MFGGILILICSAMHAYVLWRISSVPFIKRRLSFKQLLAIMLVLWAAFFSGVFFGRDLSGILASSLQTIAMTWMVVVFLTFTCLLMADLLTGFGLFIRRYAAAIRGWALIASVALSITALIQGHRAPVIDKFDIQINHLPKNLDGAVIAVLADMHADSQIGSKWITARVTQVEEQKPDLIVLLGDIVEGRSRENQDAFAAALSKLKAPFGVYGVLGNHEYYGARDNDVSSVYDKAGISLLRGEWKELKPGLVLAGIDPPQGRMGKRDFEPGYISTALKGRPEGAVILLSHFPQGADEAAKSGVDLMLSGHTHGGQIWPFNWIERSFYRYMEGEYNVKGMQLIVSRGAGTWGPRMRLWKPGEIVLVTLHAAAS